MNRNQKLLLLSFPAAIALCAACYAYVDVPAARFFHKRPGAVRDFFELITHLGRSTWYLVFSFLVFAWCRYAQKRPFFSHAALFVFCSIAAAGIANAAIKFFFGRYRPSVLFDHHLYGFTFFGSGYDHTSFPSGHANTMAALALALYLLTNRHGVLYLGVAALVAASRVVIGAHFVSDAVFGAYLAVPVTLLVKTVLAKRGLWVRQPFPDKEDAACS